MKIFARNFRGFKKLILDPETSYFLVGDNSSGKSSLLYLLDAVCRFDLNHVPAIDEDFGAAGYDYFSPYFEHKDVKFGFLDADKGDASYGKVITVRRVEGDKPEITRCTHWFPGRAVTLKALSDGVSVTHSEAPDVLSEDDLLKLHSRRFKGSKAKKTQSKLIAHPISILKIDGIDRDDSDKMVTTALSANLKRCRFVSPIRALPTRFYSSARKFDPQGSHFAKAWIDIRDQDKSLVSSLSKFGIESNLFTSLSVRSLEAEVEDPPLVVTVEKNGRSFTLDQVGIGVSQVVPLLIDTLLSTEVDHFSLLCQQPELHLHPVAQAALGSYLYRSKKRGLVGVYETHSSYLLDRFRAEFRDDAEKVVIDGVASDFKILFCQSSDGGNKAHEISICENGALKGEPDEFHEFLVDEFMRTIF